MEILRNKEEPKTRVFSEVVSGEVFFASGDYYMRVYMSAWKKEEGYPAKHVNAVKLDDGAAIRMGPDQIVYRVTAELHVD